MLPHSALHERLRPQPPIPRRSALRLLGGAIVVAAAATGGLAVPSRAHARDGHGPDAGTRQGAGARVEGLLARLTLDEKVSLLHGATDPSPLGQAGYVPGVARLGIPPLRLADGPAGVRVTRHATALPAPVLLASAFDPDLARRYGQVIGREGRALGQDVLLSPMVNLIRTPVRRPQLRDLQRGPAALRPSGRRRDRGHPGRGTHRDGQALRAEQPGARPHLGRRPGR
ncbi:glycoside hydrolase family 3 N-terminal domain-containing protein [Streptomyces sp. NPDC006235]|uniref:glycoside hydrolase family 3 N-terminal domain-containing protein n=1 Tax=Streptomyces sp. NPDC006235 TaxID=3156736 RepID=UPI0033ADD87D